MTVNALQMNLVALQRQDRAITSIIETSPQVTLYSFEASQKQWVSDSANFIHGYVIEIIYFSQSRTEIEGSLFICERSGDQRCSMIILNKKDPRNHKEKITKSFELQVQEKFLLYKVSSKLLHFEPQASFDCILFRWWCFWFVVL